ncbi:MAG: undecaprenyl/decaprenyl-phosphate alpha-N-acetylglucosaminyl 1-phosphate transferase [Oscillospiraceae bacterium]|nr:undecaprenyl/decaprenyl-phosphate alpha-N-acetylglucosaminyl 1-phosphate transferase [Oscillospiraceae bacterium]
MQGNLSFPTEPEFYFTIFFALAAALIVSFAVTPLVRMLAGKVGAVDDPGRDSRRMHTEPIPRLGGLAIFLGFMTAFLIFGMDEMDKTVTGILIGAVLMVVVGALDDVLSLPWWGKLAGQIAAAAVPVICGLRADIFTNPVLFFNSNTMIDLGAFSIPVTILWIVVIANAVNLIDGLDGLAVGVSGIASLSMLLIAIATGNPAAALLTAALTGGCLGFLPYNFNPARLFMGDSGSLFLGYILSCVSILGLFKFFAVLYIVPFLILGLPIFDTAASFFRRLLKGQNPMKPDQGHVHHRLINMGFSQKQAVAILYSVSAVLGLSAVVLTTTNELRVVILLLTVLAVSTVYIILAKKHKRKNKEHDGEEPE